MQLRISPGAGTFSSLRSRPLEPPSSLTVTIARQLGDDGKSGASHLRRASRRSCFSPCSRVESPVPPPMATTLMARSSAELLCSRHELRCRAAKSAIFRFAGRHFGAGVRIEQFGEPGVVGQVLEIGIVARLETVCRIQPNGFVQAGDGFGKVAGQAVQRRHAVPDEIQLGSFLIRCSKFSRAVT